MVDFFGASRITNNSREIQFNVDRRRIDGRIFKTQRELSTGKRINVPSDDPVGANRALSLARILEDNRQFSANIEVGSTRLGNSEAALQDLNEIANRARDILLTHINESSDPNARAQAAVEVARLFEQAVAIGNTKLGDEFLFAGINSTVAPFQRNGSFVEYTGSETELTTRVAFGQTEAVSISGSRAFGALSAQVAGDVDLDPNMTGPTLLADLNGGQGVALGRIRITSGVADVTVDLRDADDLQDVLDRINASGAATAVIDGVTGDRLVITGVAATVRVEEVDATTARDLGIFTNGVVASPFTGSDVDPAVTTRTTIANLRDGAGLTGPPTAITITNGGQTAVVDLSTVTTVEGMLAAINASGVNVLARINATGDGIDVVSRLQGARLTITEAGGTTAAELGLLLELPEQDLNDLNNGLGVITVAGNDFRILARDGVAIDVDVDTATTVQDLIDLINNDPQNAGRILADFVPGTDQLRLTDLTGAVVNDLSVTKLNGSFAARDLGIEQTIPGPGTILTGTPLSPAGVQTQSLFTVLLNLQQELEGGNTATLTALGDDLQGAQDILHSALADLGARVRRLDITQERHDSENERLEILVSDIVDVDAAEAITRLQKDQTLLEAPLRTSALVGRLSLLDFI